MADPVSLECNPNLETCPGVEDWEHQESRPTDEPAPVPTPPPPPPKSEYTEAGPDKTKDLIANPSNNQCVPPVLKYSCDPEDVGYYNQCFDTHTLGGKVGAVEQMQRPDLEPAVAEQGWMAFTYAAPQDAQLVDLALQASVTMPQQERGEFQKKIIVAIQEGLPRRKMQRPSDEVQMLLMSFPFQQEKGDPAGVALREMASGVAMGDPVRVQSAQKRIIDLPPHEPPPQKEIRATGPTVVLREPEEGRATIPLDWETRVQERELESSTSLIPVAAPSEPLPVATVVDELIVEQPPPEIATVLMSRMSLPPALALVPGSIEFRLHPEDLPRLRQLNGTKVEASPPTTELATTSTPVASVPTVAGAPPQPVLERVERTAPREATLSVNREERQVTGLREALPVLTARVERYFEEQRVSRNPTPTVRVVFAVASFSDSEQLPSRDHRERRPHRSSGGSKVPFKISLFGSGEADPSTPFFQITAPVPISFLQNLSPRDVVASVRDLNQPPTRPQGQVVGRAEDRSQSGGNPGTGEDGLGDSSEQRRQQEREQEELGEENEEDGESGG